MLAVDLDALKKLEKRVLGLEIQLVCSPKRKVPDLVSYKQVVKKIIVCIQPGDAIEIFFLVA